MCEMVWFDSESIMRLELFHIITSYGPKYALVKVGLQNSLIINISGGKQTLS